MTERLTHSVGPLLWVSLTAGIVLWGIHITGMAALSPLACEGPGAIVLHLLSVATLVPTLAAIIPAWSFWRQRERGVGGVAFLGAMGVLLNAVSALAIVAEWVPVFVLHPCTP
ncbi:MAG: hypothetical protein KY469_19280 [Actinobacteria bacterium]|nr:hypothetical protein [Actinomycetota bacterium]